MSRDELHERIADQFSYRGTHAEIWRAFDRFLDTEQFLNLGYSAWYQPHVIGSSQRRLAARIGGDLAHRLPRTEGVPLLDVGCGRGGPTLHLASAHGFDVTGIDLVSFNVATAQENARKSGVPAAFVVGDTARLPFREDAFTVCTALDSIVYVPEKGTAFEELSRAVRDDGLVAVSDVVVRDGVDPSERAVVAAFADAWDMPAIPTARQYRHHIENGGFAIEAVQDISPNSTDRFRKWTWLYLGLSACCSGLIGWVLRDWNVDYAAITEQVRRAHAALPYLRHLLVYARNQS